MGQRVAGGRYGGFKIFADANRWQFVSHSRRRRCACCSIGVRDGIPRIDPSCECVCGSYFPYSRLHFCSPLSPLSLSLSPSLSLYLYSKDVTKINRKVSKVSNRTIGSITSGNDLRCGWLSDAKKGQGAGLSRQDHPSSFSGPDQAESSMASCIYFLPLAPGWEVWPERVVPMTTTATTTTIPIRFSWVTNCLFDLANDANVSWWWWCVWWWWWYRNWTALFVFIICLFSVVWWRKWMGKVSAIEFQHIDYGLSKLHLVFDGPLSIVL